MPPKAAEGAAALSAERQPARTNSGAGYFIPGRLSYGIHNGIRRRTGDFDHYQLVTHPLASRTGFQASEKPVGS
ncbi:MAG: hypothetical protein WAW61_12340 [Methylococcaceae bacterium]